MSKFQKPTEAGCFTSCFIRFVDVHGPRIPKTPSALLPPMFFLFFFVRNRPYRSSFTDNAPLYHGDWRGLHARKSKNANFKPTPQLLTIQECGTVACANICSILAHHTAARLVFDPARLTNFCCTYRYTTPFERPCQDGLFGAIRAGFDEN